MPVTQRVTESQISLMKHREEAGAEEFDRLVERLHARLGDETIVNPELSHSAETCERPSEIDVARAQEAKSRAEERLKSGNPDVDYERAEEALQRADARLEVARK